MSAPIHSREADLAFLEDLAFMLETGESFATAATRFGIGERGLQRRVAAAKKRLHGGDRRSGNALQYETIRGQKKTAPARGGTRGTRSLTTGTPEWTRSSNG